MRIGDGLDTSNAYIVSVEVLLPRLSVQLSHIYPSSAPVLVRDSPSSRVDRLFGCRLLVIDTLGASQSCIDRLSEN
ncbi:hypothetical protein PIIN_08130 [Serendipita indica DSM 11827]|uniref:Uncharacterized protein n=1 Tax=Serendipita indica (strain DSM 11827) TaxID=1109443 RepID=G4TS84_SERID|nr:hypothetical protein PIIN_08130 [Serendipita indica DSM 11827]